MKTKYLYFTAFVCGFVVLAIEILGTRVIAPRFGTTVYTWSGLISVTLVALAAGYFFGGWAADRQPKTSNVYLLISLAAVFTALIPVLAKLSFNLSWAMGQRAGSFVMSLLLFFVPLFLLGAVSPYIIRLSAAGDATIGVKAGTLYGISTIGSFAGAILTGYILLSVTGVKNILYLNASLLALTAAAGALLEKKTKHALLALIPAALCLVNLFALAEINQKGPLKVVARETSAYTDLKVVDDTGRNIRALLADNTVQSDKSIDGPADELTDYMELFVKPAVMVKSGKKALVIGLGSGAISSRYDTLGFEVTSVDIDPKIIKLAKEHFGFTGRAVVSDGRVFLRNSKEKFDIIIIDVYRGNSPYPYLFTSEAYAEAKEKLGKGGILVVNSIGEVKGKAGAAGDTFLDSVAATLSINFSHVAAKAAWEGLTACVFYASDTPFEAPAGYIDLVYANKGRVITDDFNTVDFMTSGSVEKWQAALKTNIMLD